ncbi:MAG: hypothetical protein ABI877_05260 [Gemmatimonadaceae bacterium]
MSCSSRDVWAAVPEGNVENGTTVTVFGAMLMTKFESKSLKRTFDEVYFGALTPPNAAAIDPSVNPQATAPQSVSVGHVEKATGADARTVSEVWAQREHLVGKSVSIRGVVVKYNGGVMGKNWIHLQDGTGDPTKHQRHHRDIAGPRGEGQNHHDQRHRQLEQELRCWLHLHGPHRGRESP